MENKYKIVFLLTNNNSWQGVISQIKNLLKVHQLIEDIAVVITNSAVLSCFKENNLEEFKTDFDLLDSSGIKFWICANTLKKYNIPPDILFNQLEIAEQGGILKVIEYQSKGYFLIQ
jgi:Uncharacterized conserved protein